MRSGALSRSPSFCSLILGLAALIGSTLLTACGGGGGAPVNGPVEDTAGASAPPTGIAQAPRTAPALPVVPQARYAASGPGSYQDALTQYNRVGEALHGQ